jgi:hypothetical protein
MSLLVAFCIEILIVSAIQTVYRIANPWEMGARLFDWSIGDPHSSSFPPPNLS